jgi:hypothetical protein
MRTSSDGRASLKAHALSRIERRRMDHWMDGWGWFWMSFMMVFWVVVLGAVVYAAVRLANRPPRDPKSLS